ncbi:hypothetical protein [Hymenobacter sp. APR13]|uniref:hypothetical protein n=1 Tax=Hymenobacter sp. APR13 TaxID=1356852 RepID=UPI0012E0312F|nr:hypothetical protein [Hymenobacter sp. APR13]
MAIWQYRLTAVPEDAVRRRYDHLPTQLFIDHEGRRKAWQHRSFTDEDDEPTFNDAYSTAWWDGLHIPATPVATQLDALLPRTTWGKPSPDYYSWKSDNENGPDHDCYLHRNETTDALEWLEFRTDLRPHPQNTGFLAAMLTLCREQHLLVFDDKGWLMKPEVPAVWAAIEQSSAVRFLTKPQEFLDEIRRKLAEE